uniref:LIF receptor subunit alpha a n=1 Tax=Pristiophorus japonicus TaxID=55135 RepID=UPI00398E4FF0
MKMWVLLEFAIFALLLSGSRLAIAENADQCGSISPNRLVANVGSNHSITCYFCGEGAADMVQWKFGGNLLPSSQYSKVNSSASMVTLLNLDLASREGEKLSCTSEKESYTTLIQTGYPPDVPRDVACVTQELAKIVCSWNQGRDTHIETNYSVCYRSPRDCKKVGTANFVESDFYLFEDLILQISAVNELGTQTSERIRVEENDIVFRPHVPELLRVFKGPSDFQLMVEWNEGGVKYGLDLKMIFQIQVIRTYKMHEVWTGNYSTTLEFTHNRTLQLTWESDMPLQCTSHSVRIRCIGNDSDFLFAGVRAWSDWSPLVTLEGQDTSNHTSGKIYPVDGTVLKAGSSPTFCCIARKGTSIVELSFNRLNGTIIELSDRSQAIRVQNVSQSIESGSNAFCVFSSNDFIGAVIFIGYPPDSPKNLSCETRDLQTLNCTWEPGKLTGLVSHRITIYSLINGSSQNSLPCNEASRNNPYYWCGLPISNSRDIHNISINAINPLGEAQSSIKVDVARVFHPFAPRQLRQEAKTSENITVSWSDEVDYTGTRMLCEMVISDDVVMTSHNYSVSGGPEDAQHTVILNNLRPNTRYSIRARYSSLYFWKWSKWSNVLNVTTKQAAPAVSLNVWRTIKPDRTVTVYWKPLSDTNANGPVLSYNVTWTRVGSVLSRTTETSMTNARIALDQAGYIITVTAKNSAGASPPSVIRIPPQRNEKTFTEKATGVGNGFNVTWPKYQAGSCGYIVQWCNFQSSQLCDLDWRKFPSDSTQAIIKSDAFQPGVRYDIEVHECRDDGDHLLKQQVGYTRELAPSEAPKLNIRETTGESVQIEWKTIPVEKRRGFIEGFKVYYSKLYNDSAAMKPMSPRGRNAVNPLPKIVNSSLARAFKITGLEPGTTYRVALSTYTKGGESPSTPVTVTTPNSPIALILGITLPLVGILALGIILSIFCYRKQEWIKETFYPDIPNPNNSKVLQDGNFLQGVNVCKTLEPKDCTPNEVQVVEEKRIGGAGEKEVEADYKGEVVPDDVSDTESQDQGVLSYNPHRAPPETSGETNPAFEATAPLSPSIYPSEVTYTSIRGPVYHQQGAPMEDGAEVIAKSGYQPQIHGATNQPPGETQNELQELVSQANGYQPQTHRVSWTLDPGDFPPPETESIGSPTSINSQAFLIPEKPLGKDSDFKPKMWSLPFFNSRLSSNSDSNSNNS